MRERFSMTQRWLLLTLIALLLVGTANAATRERVLHSFPYNTGKDGYIPIAGLTSDSAGNLYGTTISGGADGCGTVFALTPKSGGGWREGLLHSFTGNTDGCGPFGGLIVDTAGNLYGTTAEGGGCGTVFEIRRKPGGGWTEEILYGFNSNRSQGCYPAAGLIFDASGNLYGTTGDGGAYGDFGTVFELTPKAGGGWQAEVLYSFNGSDGAASQAALVFDAAGNLYGTTIAGGAYGLGSVFELTPAAGGGWQEAVLHSFKGIDGQQPYGSLIFDTEGNLYSTAEWGGARGYGAVFELMPTVGGDWKEEILHSFNGADGANPSAGLIFDGAGNLYGTTNGGNSGCGTVFELRPKPGGGWGEGVFNFDFDGENGCYSTAGLIFDSAGNLLGTTSRGGAYGWGTVFGIEP